MIERAKLIQVVKQVKGVVLMGDLQISKMLVLYSAGCQTS